MILIFYMNIGEKIRCIRHIRGLKQESIAEELNMSVNGYGKIERNEGHVSLERLEQIAKVFGMHVKDILDLDENITHQHLRNQHTERVQTLQQAITTDERKRYEDTIVSLLELLKMKDEMLQELQNKK